MLAVNEGVRAGSVPGAGFGRPTPADARLDVLDGLRFAAAVGVLFWHYQHFWYLGGALAGFSPDQQPLYSLLSGMYTYTVYGVQVFWCLSGYIFFWKYGDSVARGAISAKKFFVLRFSRLYPLHALTFVAVAMLQFVHHALTERNFVYQNNDLFHAALHVFMASNWGFESGLSFNGPIWSVSVEVLVYALFFAVLRVFGHRVWISLALVAVAAAAYLAKIPNAIFQGVVCFYMSGLAVTLGHTSWARSHRLAVRNAAVVLLVVLPLVGALLGLFQKKLFLHFLVVFYCPVLLYWMAEHVALPRSWQPAFATAGNLTYSSYLIHFPIQLVLVIGYHMAGRAVPRESAGFLCLYLGLTLVAGYGVYRYFEAPTQQWLRRRLPA